MKTSPFSFTSIRSFAHQHDDLPAFHAAYLVLTFLAAALFNLGFFAVLVLVHMGLDIFKYREVHSLNWKQTVEGVIRESLIDVTLLFMGLVVSVYLNPALAFMSGIHGLMLAELTVLRMVGMMTPKLKILYDFLKILAHIDHYLNRMHRRIGQNASMIEYVCIFSLCVSVGMLVIAPIILVISNGQFAEILLSELTPWKI